MAQTKIEWTEVSWNPITGCTKFSDGCTNCYAETFANRLKAMKNPRYKDGFALTIHHDLIETPLKWRKPKMIFVNSMSDLFHEDIPEKTILGIFKTMNSATWHTFQILTKRSKRLVQLSSKINWSENIWMGVSVENKDALYRCDDLRKTDAKIKFVSAEPLLEDIKEINLKRINWLIVGGESGHASRPMKEEWVKNLRVKAKIANTAFFFKQWGGLNKKKNGFLLDGEVCQEYPTYKRSQIL